MQYALDAVWNLVMDQLCIMEIRGFFHPVHLLLCCIANYFFSENASQENRLECNIQFIQNKIMELI